MPITDVKTRAFAMPLTSPAFPPGPYRFINREYFIIAYRTDPEAIEKILPAPLRAPDPIVKYEFIRMPDSTGFGDYTETGQVIPVEFTHPDGRVERGGYTHAMYLDDEAPIAGGREIWGFPKKLAKPQLRVEADTLVGTLEMGSLRVVVGTMGYKYHALAHDKVLASMREPGFLLKIIPHVDGTVRVCELVRYTLGDITVKGAWSGPAALDLRPHALAPVADLPVREILSATHILADLTLELGTVVHDYLA